MGRWKRKIHGLRHDEGSRFLLRSSFIVFLGDWTAFVLPHLVPCGEDNQHAAKAGQIGYEHRLARTQRETSAKGVVFTPGNGGGNPSQPLRTRFTTPPTQVSTESCASMRPVLLSPESRQLTLGTLSLATRLASASFCSWVWSLNNPLLSDSSSIRRDMKRDTAISSPFAMAAAFSHVSIFMVRFFGTRCLTTFFMVFMLFAGCRRVYAYHAHKVSEQATSKKSKKTVDSVRKLPIHTAHR